MLPQHDQARAARIEALSLVATVTLIKILGCKRLCKCMAQKTPVPANLKKMLADTMQSCAEMSLCINGALQARALKWAK